MLAPTDALPHLPYPASPCHYHSCSLQNAGFFYRFRIDDGTFRDRHVAQHIEQNGGQIFR
jgi:hypothetical protein